MEFSSFCEKLGFTKYPFSTFTSENEKSEIEHIFVKPDIQHPLETAFNQGASLIISGDRGTGKTALLHEISKNRDDKKLVVNIENYETLNKNYTKTELYKFLISRFSEEAIPYIAKHDRLGLKLSKDDKLLLSYLVKHHLQNFSKIRIEERLKEIQIGLWKRIATGLWSIIRHPANYATNAGVTFVSDLIKRNAPWIVDVDNQRFVEYFREIKHSFEQDFSESEISLNLLRKACGVLKKVGASQVIFIIDKIDEDGRLDSDAEEIAAFAKPILSDTKHFTSEEFKLAVGIWIIPFIQIKDDIRTQKIVTKQITWTSAGLESALNKRLSHFSKGKVKDYRGLFDEKTTSNEIIEIFELSNGNPRDLWHILDKIINAQFSQDPSLGRISSKAIHKGKIDFVEQFNYYEYYPKKVRSNARSRDIYSYIALLGRLQEPTFTVNGLKTQSGAGSSAQNFVTQMQNMGLIKRLEIKKERGTVYAVRDPKITYAIKNKISIRKDGSSVDTDEEMDGIEIQESTS